MERISPVTIEQITEHVVVSNPEQRWITDNLLFLHIGGSRLYGTNTADSDWDIRGVTIAPEPFWIGTRRFDSTEFTMKAADGKDVDVVIYDFRRWLKLTLDGNPNVIETLYVDDVGPCSIGGKLTLWNPIRIRIHPLINQRVHSAFHGYATAQLKKMVVKQSNKTGRTEITAQHGYDTKFAMHGFRLARQGAELLRRGMISFPRPDAAELLQIRDGAKFQNAEDCIAAWEQERQQLDYALLESLLPSGIDDDQHNAILRSMFYELVASPEPMER